MSLTYLPLSLSNDVSLYNVLLKTTVFSRNMPIAAYLASLYALQQFLPRCM